MLQQPAQSAQPFDLNAEEASNTPTDTDARSAKPIANTPSKAGRHSRFTAEQDIAIVREVAAAEAHLAAFGETRKRYETAANHLSDNPIFTSKLSWKQVQDRYKHLQDQYDAHDKDNKRLSGVGGGEMGELADLLMTMRESRDDILARKDAGKAEEKKKEEEKERIGNKLIAAATSRRETIEDEEDVDEDGPTSSQSIRKKRCVGQSIDGAHSEMDRFGEHMKQADLARVDLEKKHLDFERERYESDYQDRLLELEERRKELEDHRRERREEREDDRRERREEREESNKLELEKFT